MHTDLQRRFVFDTYWFRAGARATAAVLASIWLVMVLAEAIRARFEIPSRESLYQAVVIAIVFAGYAIGFRKELVGGLIAILGTLAFFAVNRFFVGGFPSVEAALFAAPGILYVLAWYSERQTVSHARRL
jgi:hypothetical protein